MARTRANGQDGRPALPPTEATRGRGRSRGRGRAAGAAHVDPPVAPARGGSQTPVARTPETIVQRLQTPEAPPVHQVVLVQPVAPVQEVMVPVMQDDEQRHLERFSKLAPPPFSGAQGEDAQGFLDKCRRMLRIAGILETSGVSFTTFQFSGAAFTWWEAYKRRRPVGSAPLSWQEFSTLFLEKWVPRS
uniref:Uncharacterized protein LOC104211588 n=1 Tax=Nicotiana sylvestris TaxID=4096 RepID=A0A1U7UXS3_NICSY